MGKINLAKFAAHRQVIVIHKIYVDICDGDLQAGSLLSKLIYWFTPNDLGVVQAHIKKHGRLWVANHRDKWWDILCMKPRVYDRAAKVLVEKGFVTQAVMKTETGVTLAHLSINDDRIMASIIDVENSDPDPSRWRNPMQVHEMITEYLNGNSRNTLLVTPNICIKEKKNIEKELTQFKDQPPKIIGGEQTPNPRTGMSAEDIVKGMKDKKGKIDYTPTNAKLQMLWKDRMALIFPDEFQTDLPLVSQTLMKRMLRAIGEDFPYVLDFTLQHWSRFISEVDLQKNSSGPIRPSVPFLYTHQEVAVNLYRTPKIDKLNGVMHNDSPQIQPNLLPVSTHVPANAEEVLATASDLEAELDAIYASQKSK